MAEARTTAEWLRAAGIMSVIVSTAPYMSAGDKKNLLKKIQRCVPRDTPRRPTQPLPKVPFDQFAREMGF